jgi:hypothetical protein
MHGEFLCRFLQAHRGTQKFFRFMGMPAQPDQDSFRFRCAAFYASLKSKVGLTAAKAAFEVYEGDVQVGLTAAKAAFGGDVVGAPAPTCLRGRH